jgi:hypothetical protein
MTKSEGGLGPIEDLERIGRCFAQKECSRMIHRMTVLRILIAVLMLAPIRLSAQATGASTAAPDSLPPEGGAIDVPTAKSGRAGPYLLLGGAYSQRRDGCPFCSGLDDDDNFTGHLRVGRHLGAGFGLGLDASVWRRSRSDVVSDGETTESETQLQTLLGNLSLSLNYRIWQLYLHAGGGLAYGRVDLPDPANEGGPLRAASGLGIGYSAGAGIGLPMAGPVSLTLFANWNVGRYDLISQGFTMASDIEHRFLEVGLGLGFN